MANADITLNNIGQMRDGVSWTPHDTNPIVDSNGEAQPWRGFIPDTDGTVTCQTQLGGAVDKLIPVKAGGIYPCDVRLIKATGTDSTALFVYL